MTDLDALIKKSLSQATPHSKRVFSQNPMTAEEVFDLATGTGLRFAATVKPNGRPHLSITDIILLDGEFYIGVDLATARYRNLKDNPGIILMMAEGWKRQAIIEGEVRFLDMKSQLKARVLDAQKKKYGWTSELIAQVAPKKIFTWKAPAKPT